MDEIVQIISNLGFPVAVAIWYMYTSNKTQQDMTKAINDMSIVINNNTNAINTFKGM